MKQLRELTLAEKIGQLLMVSLEGFDLDAEADRFLAEHHFGSIIHFGNNVRERQQATVLNAALTSRLTERLGVPPLIGIDHEGGRVMRFKEGVTLFPAAMAVGAAGDEDLAEQVGRAMGEELRAMGFHINFAPVLDVNSNAANPVIGGRAYGDTVDGVCRYGLAVARGMQGAGLMACGKHFPGHGDTHTDSHFDLPTVDKSVEALEAMELAPFAEAIAQGVEAMMTTHILYPAFEPQKVPATMSSAILQGLLREKMGFTGLIVSDGMHMKAIAAHYGVEAGCVEAIKAGVDLLCIGTAGPNQSASQASCFRALLEAAETGEIPMARIDDAVSRVLAAKMEFCHPYAGSVDWEANALLAEQVADASITRLRGEGGPVTGRVLCASRPTAEIRSGVSQGDWVLRSFADVAADALGGMVIPLEEGMDFAALDGSDTVVVGISRADEPFLEGEFLREALRRGKRAVAVITGLPYLSSLLPEGCEAICSYSAVMPSIRAACRALRGEIPAAGKLPVRVG